MLRHLSTIAAGLLLAGSLFAVPAKRFTVKVKQADGTTVSLQLVGDESFHYYRTLDGVPVAQRTDGTYCYAALRDGKLALTERVAHDASERTADETLFIEQNAAKAGDLQKISAENVRLRNERRAARVSARKATAQSAAQRVGQLTDVATGDRKGLVILVNFKDKKMNAAHTREVFDDMMNKEGYTGNGNSGSVHDYFYKQSYGKFNLTFDVVGPVTVSRNMSYYGTNQDGEAGYDKYPHIMVEEACELVADDPSVNWADYDWDNDGEVDQVFVIYAGYNEAQGGAANTIWPHESNLSYYGYSKTFGGKTINIYGCSSELRNSSGNELDGIGTACHEFSHCLGLPDLYDTGYGDNFGMYTWSLMDSGNYNNDSNTPAAYTAYERMASGWLTPVELTEGCSVEGMKPLVDSPEAYIIYNDKNNNEYYLLENRQQKDFDKYVGGHGMLVTHVDYDASVWNYNTVNNTTNHQRCTIIHADNNDYTSDAGLAGDPFPGTSSNHSLTDTTTPASTLFNANTDGRKYMGKPLTDIYEDGENISFTFMGGKRLDTPTALYTSDITSTSFTANWDAVENASSYSLEVREAGGSLPSDNITDEEDFSKWGDGLTTDKNADISDRLNTLFTTPGWTGTKVFEGPARAKLGSSSQAGELNSPLYAAPASGNVTVRLSEQYFNNDSKKMTVALLNSAGKDAQTTDIVLNGSEHVVNFSGVADEFSVSFRPAKRCYLTNTLAIYDGEYTADDFADEKSVSAAPARRAASITISVDGTEYAVTDLNPAATYSWRVKAVGEKTSSAWSELQTVSLPEGIDAVTVAQPSGDDTVEVYAPDGRKLRTARYAGWGDGLPSGTYLLRHANGTVKAANR